MGPTSAAIASSTAAAFGLEARPPRVAAELVGKGPSTAAGRRTEGAVTAATTEAPSVAMSAEVGLCEEGLRDEGGCVVWVAFDG